MMRTRSKVECTVGNAKQFWKLVDRDGSFDDYIWSFVGVKPVVNRWSETKQIPATSAASDALAKDLKKRGFKFVGSTVMYAHLQAAGLVNDHLTSCWRWREVGKSR